MMFTYFQRNEDTKAAATTALLCVEHMYYKHDTVAKAVHRSNAFAKVYGRYSDLHPASLGKENIPQNGSLSSKGFNAALKYHPASYLGIPFVAPVEYNPGAKLDAHCKFIFKFGDDRCKTRALLCSVYYNALHDRYYHARDLMLISHVQETIEKTDAETQILYNRALVTLGLAAFRLGLIQKAHECLSGICSGRVRDLLAQGHSKYQHDKDPEQERMERRRQMPYHMHISPDLLESCHLISAMLLELPQMSKPQGVNPYIISKQFRKYLHSYGLQLFTGPPENTRDLVMASAKALLAGDWRKTCSLLLGSEVWNLIPDEGGEKLRVTLRARIKEEAVRIFILKYGAHYDSIGLQHLRSHFEMEEGLIRRIVSRMIHSKEISGAWEQPADVLILYKVDPSPLQMLCQVVAEKVALLVESNERLLDPLAGAYGYKDSEWSSRDQRGGKYADGRQGRGSGWKGHPGRFPPGRGGGRGRGGRGQSQQRDNREGSAGPRSSRGPGGGPKVGSSHRTNQQSAEQQAPRQFRWGVSN